MQFGAVFPFFPSFRIKRTERFDGVRSANDYLAPYQSRSPRLDRTNERSAARKAGTQPMRIMFLVQKLSGGGAERQLAQLAANLRRRGHGVRVLTFYGEGDYEAGLEAAGVGVVRLNKTGRWDLIGFPLRLVSAIREFKPDVAHGYLPAPNVLLALLKPFIGTCKLVWGVRTSSTDRFGRARRTEFRSQALLAFAANLVIANSEAGRADAVELGFPSDRTIAIPNGIDTDFFQYDPSAGLAIRKELGLPHDAVLVGAIGRLEKIKAQDLIVRAAAALADRRPKVRYLFVGEQRDAFGGEVKALAKALGVADRVLFMAARSDIVAVYSALDILCSASMIEGFPNVVAEAMSCALPVVVTDAGDSAVLVGACGKLVPAGDRDALVRSLDQLLDLTASNRRNLGAAARDRVVKVFHRERLVERTELALTRLCAE